MSGPCLLRGLHRLFISFSLCRRELLVFKWKQERQPVLQCVARIECQAKFELISAYLFMSHDEWTWVKNVCHISINSFTGTEWNEKLFRRQKWPKGTQLSWPLPELLQHFKQRAGLTRPLTFTTYGLFEVAKPVVSAAEFAVVVYTEPSHDQNAGGMERLRSFSSLQQTPQTYRRSIKAAIYNI